MRLDHLLSKGKSKVCRDCKAIATQRRLRSVSEANVVSWLYYLIVKERSLLKGRSPIKILLRRIGARGVIRNPSTAWTPYNIIFGADAARGNTRSHPEHDG